MGRESIQVDVIEPVTEILLNCHELAIQSAVLRNASGSLEGSVELLEEDQRARISLDGEAAPGSWVLDLEFTGILNDQLVGFYRSTFTDVDGVEQAIATTQFEATDARRAFPSWDEPDFKRFSPSPSSYPKTSSLFPTGPKWYGIRPGQSAVRFADTMVMSTYLVAFGSAPSRRPTLWTSTVFR